VKDPVKGNLQMPLLPACCHCQFTEGYCLGVVGHIVVNYYYQDIASLTV